MMGPRLVEQRTLSRRSSRLEEIRGTKHLAKAMAMMCTLGFDDVASGIPIHEKVVDSAISQLAFFQLVS